MNIMLLNMEILHEELTISKKKILQLKIVLQNSLTPQEYTTHMEKFNTYLLKFRSKREETKKKKMVQRS